MVLGEHVIELTDDEINAELCRRSFFHFFKEFWEVLSGETLVANWHVPYLCEQLQIAGERLRDRLPHEGDIIVNIPPGMTKSSIITVAFPVWMWTIDPQCQVISASHSMTVSLDHATKSRDIIKSDKFQRLFPYVQLRSDSDNKGYVKNTAGGWRLATSTTSKILGMHAHLILVDDPIDPKGTDSEVIRSQVNEFMDKTLFSRKVDKAVSLTCLVMQRLHQDDPTGNMLKKKRENIKHFCLPAKDEGNVLPAHLSEKYVNGLLDPVRLNEKILADFRLSLGSYGYSGQMQQKPSPDGGGIWKYEWFKVIPDRVFPSDDQLQRLACDWDLAYTDNEKNSASAYVKAGKIGKSMYITDLGFRHLEFPALIDWMRKKNTPHYVENKGSGKSVKQVLVGMGIPCIEVDGGNKDKVARANKVTPYVEAGMVYIKESLVETLLYDSTQGIGIFPNNSHDDLHDAFTQAVQRLLGKKPFFVI